MENTNSSLEATITDGAKPSGTEGVEGTQATGQESGAKPVGDVYDPTWWQKDDRTIKRKLWKTEADVVKSYHNLEPEYNKLKEKSGNLEKQISDISGIFKEFGIEPNSEQIKNILTELKTLKDPANPVKQRANYFGYWAEHKNPSFQSKFLTFMQNLEREELQAKFPNWTDEQIAKQMENDKRLKELELKDIKREEAQKTEQATQRINTGLKSAEDYAKKVGFAWSDDIKNKLIDYCFQNKVPSAFVFETFVKIHGEALEKSLIEKAKQEQLQILNKNKGSVIPAGGSHKPAAPGTKTSWKEQALEAVKKEMST